MKAIKIFLFCIICCFYKDLAAQSGKYRLCGYVRDRGSGEVIAGATVKYGLSGTVSNNAGYYSLGLVRDTITLECSCIGFHRLCKQLLLTRDSVMDIYLEQQNILLEEARIKGENNLFTTLKSGNWAVNTNQLKAIPSFLGEQDILKLLQFLPGVTSGREGSSALNIRGGSSDQTLVMLDNIPVYNQNHAFGFVSVFNGEALSSAELYKSHVPVQYGGRLSGVSVFRMKEGNLFRHRQSLHISTISMSFTVEGPLRKGRGSYFFAGRRFIPDLFMRGYYAITGEENQTKTIFTFYDLSGKLNYKLNSHNTLFGSVYVSRDKIKVSTLDVRLPAGQKPVKLARSGGGIGWGNITSSLRLHTILGSRSFMNSTLYYSQLKNYKDNFYKNYRLPDHANSQISSKLQELGLQIVFQRRTGFRNQLTGGVHFIHQYFQPQLTCYTKKGVTVKDKVVGLSLTSVSTFISEQFNYAGFNLDVGIRASFYRSDEKNAFIFEPRLSVNREINPLNLIWFAYDRNSQALFSANKFYMGMPVNYWMPFKNNRVQTSDQFSVGWKTTLINHLNISVEGYYKRMNHLLYIYDSEGFLANEGGYDKVGGYAYGVEFTFQYSLKNFSGTTSYVWSASKRKVSGQTVLFLYDVPHNLKIAGKYITLNRGNRKQYISLAVHYHTGLPYVLSNENYPVLGMPVDGKFLEPDGKIQYNPNYPNIRLNNYFRTDLSYSFEKKKRNGIRTWQISILNLTNHQNPYMVFRKDGKYKSMTLIPFMPAISYKRTLGW